MGVHVAREQFVVVGSSLLTMCPGDSSSQSPKCRSHKAMQPLFMWVLDSRAQTQTPILGNKAFSSWGSFPALGSTVLSTILCVFLSFS